MKTDGEVPEEMKRIAAWMMLLVFLSFPAPKAAAAETRMIRTSPYDPGQEETMDGILAEMFLQQFGYGAEVEVGEDNMPISVNGYPYRTVEASFNIRSVDDKFIAETDWVDYPFWQPATQYNGSLANMSLILAVCSARDRLRNADPESFDPAQDVETYLTNAGFEDIRKDDYSKETSIYTISTAMGVRRMEHEGEEPFTLIAVGVCGGGYKNEWQSNITAGEGDLHEGFRSASDLVIDRIAGYIATRGIRGRIKLWISGFSRAAAVANLTAARLTGAGVFQKEDVYAYTYATPAAVLNPPETGNENIFNILCPTDVVPQVMPAEWHYGRYGTDLWLPVKEFSSIGELTAKEREQAIRESFGIDIYYSAALNLRMRMLLSMTLDAIGDRDYYVHNLQSAAVGILQRMDSDNLLETARNLLLSLKDTDREMRARMDGLLNFVVRVFGNALTRTELANVNRNSGSSLFLLFTEHREDTYLASMNSMLHGFFEDDTEFTYVMVKGPVELKLTLDNLPGWYMALSDQGTVSVQKLTDAEPEINPEYQTYYMERMGDVSIAAIPLDADIRLNWTATSDGTVEVRQARCGVHAATLYPGARTDALRVRAGDTGDAWIPAEKSGALPDGFRSETWHAADLTDFLGISAPLVSWRTLTMGTLLLAGLVIFLLIRLAAFFLSGKAQRGAVYWLLLALICVAAVQAEGAYWLQADRPWVRFIWKAVAGAAVLAVCCLRQGKKEIPRNILLPGLIAAVAADLVMTRMFLPGVILLASAHVLLIGGFLKKHPMSRPQWTRWALLSLILSGLAVLALVRSKGAAAWAAAACAPVLLLTVYSVNGQTARIRYAAAFLLVSDLLLGAFYTVWNRPMAHILCMALFTASLVLMADSRRSTGPRKDHDETMI